MSPPAIASQTSHGANAATEGPLRADGALQRSSAAGAAPLSWPPGPAGYHLLDDEIHVWGASLSDVQDHLCRFDSVLSPDERARAGGFHLGRDRDRFIAGRGLLRELLSRYLHQDAATIEFSYGRFGKPYIVERNGHRPLFFNVSHSDTLVLYAVSRACAVGVDVERVREIPDFEAIASRFLAAAEVKRLTLLPPDQRWRELFARWTAVEAVLKATGEGLSAEAPWHPSTGIDLQTRRLPGATRATMPARPASTRVRRLGPAPGHVGAVAYRHEAARLLLWSASDVSRAGP